MNLNRSASIAADRRRNQKKEPGWTEAHPGLVLRSREAFFFSTGGTGRTWGVSFASRPTDPFLHWGGAVCFGLGQRPQQLAPDSKRRIDLGPHAEIRAKIRFDFADSLLFFQQGRAGRVSAPRENRPVTSSSSRPFSFSLFWPCDCLLFLCWLCWLIAPHPVANADSPRRAIRIAFAMET